MATEQRLIDANELEAHFRKTKIIEVFPYWKELNPATQAELVKYGKAVKEIMQKNQYVELASGISYKGNAGEIVNAHHNDIGSKAIAFVGTSGVQLGWLASQADMLAEDWYVVN